LRYRRYPRSVSQEHYFRLPLRRIADLARRPNGVSKDELLTGRGLALPEIDNLGRAPPRLAPRSPETSWRPTKPLCRRLRAHDHERASSHPLWHVTVLFGDYSNRPQAPFWLHCPLHAAATHSRRGVWTLAYDPTRIAGRPMAPMATATRGLRWRRSRGAGGEI
jgi:hypothetical protein